MHKRADAEKTEADIGNTMQGELALVPKSLSETSTLGSGEPHLPLDRRGNYERTTLTPQSFTTDGDTEYPFTSEVHVSRQFTDSMTEEPTPFSFEGKGLTGAEVFADLCKNEGLGALFCAPGNYSIIHALAASGIPSFGGRTEGGMCSAADGFYRASGEIGACSGTEGPGLAHMIMGIATARAARTPLLILASNSSLEHDDREQWIQNISQQPITEGLKKYGKRITSAHRIFEYGGYAFRNLKSGVPGPVHLDFAREVTEAVFNDPIQLTDYQDKRYYRTEKVAVPSHKDMMEVVDLVCKAQRPLIIAGHGVFHRGASEPLLKAAELNDIAVVVSGPNRGHFPDTHRLSMSLSPNALQSADLVIFVGQYCMPSRCEYKVHPNITTIRVHPVAEDLGRNWHLELGIVGDERAFLEMLANMLPAKTRPYWINEISLARKEYEHELDSHYSLGLKYSQNGNVHPAVIGREIYQFFFNGVLDPKQTVSGWGGFTSQRFIPPRLRADRPGQTIIPMYQFGAIGVSLPMMIGAAVAVKQGAGVQRAYKGAPVLVSCSDGDLGYGMLELETAAKYRLPLIVVVYNNNASGSWFLGGSPRSLHLHLFSENIRYDRIAEQLGVHGEYVRLPGQLQPALQRCYDVAARESLPSLINVQAIKEFTCGTTYPPGAGYNPEPSIGSHLH